MTCMHIISLGAGVQSSTMALMAAAGEITPMPDCAIFADTQSEPRAVYEWLDWPEPRLPFPVHRVTAGSLFAIIGTQRHRGKFAHMPLPAFVAGKDGLSSLLTLSCTRDFKIRPIRRKLRKLLMLGEFGRLPREPAISQWIGISTDEFQRAKPSKEAWIAHRWPLLERGVSRADCLAWIAVHGYPTPPRSSCVFCPYHDDAEWKAIQADSEAWAQAVDVDERIRGTRSGQRTSTDAYLHRSLQPLRTLTFKLKEQPPDLFDEKTFAVECEGMCGV